MTFEKAVEMLELKCPVTGEAISAEELLETFKNDLEETIRRPGSWEARKMSDLLAYLSFDGDDKPNMEKTLESLKNDIVAIIDRPGSHEAVKMEDLLQSHGFREEQGLSMEI